MANRYRMYPADGAARVTRDVHCAHARLVWNLACELSTWGTPETYGEASRRKRDDGTVYVHRKRRGHHDHADANAARNILARGLTATAVVPAHAPGHGAPRSRKTGKLAARTTRSTA